jgi:hypothetical protein
MSKTGHTKRDQAVAPFDVTSSRSAAATFVSRQQYASSASSRLTARNQDDSKRKVIAFPVHAISVRRGPASWTWDATDRSNVVYWRRQRALASRKVTVKSPAANPEKSQPATQIDDDIRQRTRVNLFAGAWLMLLIIAGSWITSALVNTP